jgi:hypothetical protein
MRAARQQLDNSLNEFNRVVTALQVAKETLVKKRAAASAAKARVSAVLCNPVHVLEIVHCDVCSLCMPIAVHFTGWHAN